MIYVFRTCQLERLAPVNAGVFKYYLDFQPLARQVLKDLCQAPE